MLPRTVEAGYVLTSQEHNLMASSGAERTALADPENPYKPLGLLYGKYTLEEIIAARERQKTSGAFIFCGLEISGWPKDRPGIKITLEPLDEGGNTIRDPQPLDDDMNIITGYRKTDEFPYRRDNISWPEPK